MTAVERSAGRRQVAEGSARLDNPLRSRLDLVASEVLTCAFVALAGRASVLEVRAREKGAVRQVGNCRVGMSWNCPRCLGRECVVVWRYALINKMFREV